MKIDDTKNLPKIKKSQNLDSWESTIDGYEFVAIEEEPLNLIEMIENLEENSPKTPTKHYLETLNYYKQKLKQYKNN